MPARYRCNACGNLTRFDVTRTERSREFQHFTVAGDMNVDEKEILEETIDEVRCRWCDSPKHVEAINVI